MYGTPIQYSTNTVHNDNIGVQIQMTDINIEIQQRIINAANQLVNEGLENPTNLEVRNKMGGGSLSHISPIMRKWREDRKEQVSVALEIPADLKKSIETSLAQVWTASNGLAQSMIESIKLESTQLVDEAANERDEALSEVSTLESAVSKLEGTLLQANETISSKDIEITNQQKTIELLNSEKSSQVLLIEELKSQIVKLDAKNDNLQNELINIAKERK
ncbi:MAG: KfrA protein [Staphylococcus equorum]|nr:KfrA protein [Staphylococcus equorum]